MTVDILGIRQHPASSSFIEELFRREPLYAGAALCLTALIAPTLVAMALDERTLLGVNVWLKPLRFEIALTVYLATLAWFAGWLPERVVGTRWYRTYAACVVAAIAAEVVWIGGAAAFELCNERGARRALAYAEDIDGHIVTPCDLRP